MSFDFNPIGAIVQTVGSVITDLHTTDKERLQLDNDAYRLETERIDGQIRVNVEEAKNNSTWRPYIGKVCGHALAYNFIAQPLIVWVWHICQALGWISVGLVEPPPLQTEALMVIVTGMLGLGAARTVEKIKDRA